MAVTVSPSHDRGPLLETPPGSLSSGPRFILIDFETRSLANLKKVGAWRYAEDPSTEVLCLCWTDAGQWVPGDPEPAWVRDPNVVVVAHNAAFEKAIWRKIMVPDFGWPNIPNSRWRDTQATAAYYALPQALDQVADVLQLPVRKDSDGSLFTRSLSRPSRARATRGMLPPITAGVEERVVAYCRTDVLAEEALRERLGDLPPQEQQVWLLDQKINERGFRVNLPLVRAMQKIVTDASVPLAAEFREITGGLGFGQIAAVKGWCETRGVFLTDMRAERLAELLGVDPDGEAEDSAPADLPPDVHRALSIRQLIGSAAVKKLPAALAQTMEDSRLRGSLQYHGATPGLWAGRLLQPHNFPRGTIKGDPETKVALLLRADWELVEAAYGPAVETVVSSLRHMIEASPGRRLVAGDFAGIQARLILSFAGEHEKTAMMAAGEDVYCDMARSIYRRPITKADQEERQTGKNSVLGLGFGMGPDKFHDRYARNQPPQFAQRVVETYRKEWAPGVPRLWYGLADAAMRAAVDHTRAEHAGIEYRWEDGRVSCRLPSGRRIWYQFPEEEDGLYGPAWTYRAMKMGRWSTIHVFGGLLAENVASASARDLLVYAMFKAEAEGLPVVFTVHDEIITEPKEAMADPDLLRQILVDRPPWAVEYGVPVDVECWAGRRYQK